MSGVVDYVEVEKKVLSIQGQQVLIDRDVAELYGVETKRVNEAMKNNADKFPEGYIVELSSSEKRELVENFDRFDSLKHSSVPPTAFTEKGLYMLATILKSQKATQTTIAIIETFARIRELSRAIRQLPDMLEKEKQESLIERTGEIIGEILDDHVMEVLGDETSLELDFGVVKIKRTVKREVRKKSD